MQILLKTTLAIVIMAQAVAVHAKYTETMKPTDREINLKKDYKLVDDNGEKDQSEKLRKAIDEMASQGGGRLIIPKGTYSFKSIRLKSNIHLLIEAGTVIKPKWELKEKLLVFNIDGEQKGRDESYIENVSIRGIAGRWTVDYSGYFPKNGRRGARAVVCKMVKNFLIADMDVQDNCSVYCGMTLSPSSSKKDISKWQVSRATDGTIRNCRIFNASPGYGLVQMHGAQNVYVEDMYANGGVTVRLETGATGPNTAVFNVTGKNIVSENGRCAVMLGPHSAMNGKVQFENLTSIGSTYAAQISGGGVKEGALKHDPHAKPGIFAAGSSIKNVHAIFGTNAQIKKHSLPIVPEKYMKEIKLWYDNKFFSGPSIAPVYYDTEGRYEVIVENVTCEGFKYNKKQKIVSQKDYRPAKWGDTFARWKEKVGTRETERPKPVK